MKPVSHKWFDAQVAAFTRARPKYLLLHKVLVAILERGVHAICPSAIIEARTKEIPSFAGKILRNRAEYEGRNALLQMTDLCGARVITPLESDIRPIEAFVRSHFRVDEAASQDTLVRLGTNQFGYRGVHLIVSIKPGTFPNDEVPVRVPASVVGLRAEVQVRTISQHAWSDVGHSRLYKPPYKVPAYQIREAARIAATLESVDGAFARLASGLDSLRVNVASVADKEAAEAEVAQLETLLNSCPNDAGTAARLAQMLTALGKWDRILALARRMKHANDARLLAAQGLALCQLNKANRGGKAYRRGQAVLTRAAASPSAAVEAHTYLAESWAGHNDIKALECYQRAFDTNPSEPRALAGFLVHRIAAAKDPTIAALVRPNIEAATLRCQAQAEAGVNLPWAHIHMAIFHILLDKPFEALAEWTRAMAHSPDQYPVESAFRNITRLRDALPATDSIEWSHRLLRLARAVKVNKFSAPGSTDPLPKSLAGPHAPYAKGKDIVIIAGGCDPAQSAQLERYKSFIQGSLSGFGGTVISGGTREGVSGMVGAAAQRSMHGLCAVGYLPGSLPTDGTATIDNRYQVLRRTDGPAHDHPTPLEPLQYWADLLRAGVRPADVRLLGINGGRIAAFEYRLAAAMGARVGVVQHSGREADALALQAEWERLPGTVLLPQDRHVVEAFVCADRPSPLRPRDLTGLAQSIHDRYRDDRRNLDLPNEPEMQSWDSLDADFKASNIAQAHDIARKLAVLRLEIAPLPRAGTARSFSPRQIELLAQHEHGRWVVERLRAGWRYGPKRDNTKKLRPSIVPWHELDDQDKEKDRAAVANIPTLLARIGLSWRVAMPTRARSGAVPRARENR